ncbi:MAG: hypothetical protein NUV57_04285 [archaeon]|nr:hypothetical protein [archaeon]
MKKGQLSVELVIIIGVVIILSLMILTKFISEEGTIFNDATARQIAISEIGKFDKQYTLDRIQTAICEENLKIVVSIYPSLELSPNNKTDFEQELNNAFPSYDSVNIIYSAETITCP